MMADEFINNGWCNAVMVRLDRMEKAQDETRETLREVAAAINKLAVIEERHFHPQGYTTQLDCIRAS